MKYIMTKELRIDSPLKFDRFTSAVIDRAWFNRIRSYLQYVQSSSWTKILVGGESDHSIGYYIQPTLIETTLPKDKLMREELIFGPLLTIYVYDDERNIEKISTYFNRIILSIFSFRFKSISILFTIIIPVFFYDLSFFQLTSTIWSDDAFVFVLF